MQRHNLIRLSLANCDLSSKDMDVLFKCLEKNVEMSMTIQHLDISGDKVLDCHLLVPHQQRHHNPSYHHHHTTMTMKITITSPSLRHHHEYNDHHTTTLPCQRPLRPPAYHHHEPSQHDIMLHFPITIAHGHHGHGLMTVRAAGGARLGSIGVMAH